MAIRLLTMLSTSLLHCAGYWRGCCFAYSAHGRQLILPPALLTRGARAYLYLGQADLPDLRMMLRALLAGFVGLYLKPSTMDTPEFLAGRRMISLPCAH